MRHQKTLMLISSFSPPILAPAIYHSEHRNALTLPTFRYLIEKEKKESGQQRSRPVPVSARVRARCSLRVGPLPPICFAFRLSSPMAPTTDPLRPEASLPHQRPHVEPDRTTELFGSLKVNGSLGSGGGGNGHGLQHDIAPNGHAQAERAQTALTLSPQRNAITGLATPQISRPATPYTLNPPVDLDGLSWPSMYIKRPLLFPFSSFVGGHRLKSLPTHRFGNEGSSRSNPG